METAAVKWLQFSVFSSSSSARRSNRSSDGVRRMTAVGSLTPPTALSPPRARGRDQTLPTSPGRRCPGMQCEAPPPPAVFGHDLTRGRRACPPLTPDNQLRLPGFSGILTLLRDFRRNVSKNTRGRNSGRLLSGAARPSSSSSSSPVSILMSSVTTLAKFESQFADRRSSDLMDFHSADLLLFISPVHVRENVLSSDVTQNNRH